MMLSSTVSTNDTKLIKNIQLGDGNQIPKLIHYCWFGKRELPQGLKKCIDSWSLAEGYVVFQWDETNCSFDENDFVRKAYEEKQYAFVSDYYRLKALYEYGGIYLDTDVLLKKSFDNLLQYKMFLNFITDCSVGTAVIGSMRKGKLVKELLDIYDNCILKPKTEMTGRRQIVEKNGSYFVYGFPTNNYFFTYYILKNYPEFRLNNAYQDLDDFVIFPKELFEIGTLTGKHYCIHLCAGEWRTNKDDAAGIRKIVKRLLSRNEHLYSNIQVLVRKRRYSKMKKLIPFYPYYLAQKKGSALPEL